MGREDKINTPVRLWLYPDGINFDTDRFFEDNPEIHPPPQPDLQEGPARMRNEKGKFSPRYSKCHPPRGKYNPPRKWGGGT